MSESQQEWNTIRPLNDRVVIRAIAPPRMVGNLVMPESAMATSTHMGQLGRVLAVGPGRLRYKKHSRIGRSVGLPLDGSRIPMQVKEGQLVVYQRYQADGLGYELDNRNEDGKTVVLREQDILAVVDEEE